MGRDNGFLSLVTVPEVRNVTDLKGRTVSVVAERLSSNIKKDYPILQIAM
jgi:hypothetical protein